MGNSEKEKGYQAGQEGKPASSNPHDTGIGGRVIDIAVDVASGGLAKQVETSDQNSSDWKSGHQAGTESRNEKK